ncbi:hypothetical protein F5883DRAFT_576170, partial [Diaporthe sp. PMI_573]
MCHKIGNEGNLKAICCAIYCRNATQCALCLLIRQRNATWGLYCVALRCSEPWARMAYVDIGHAPAQKVFQQQRHSINYKNVALQYDNTYKVLPAWRRCSRQGQDRKALPLLGPYYQSHRKVFSCWRWKEG